MSVPARPAPLFADIDDVARRLAEAGYLADTGNGHRRSSSPTGWRSRCWSRARPASARPSWPRRSRGRPAPTWSGCSATRASTRRGRSTSGTTRSSCCASRPTGDERDWEETHDDIFTERVPADPAAADGDPARRADRAAHRRGRQGRRRDRGRCCSRCCPTSRSPIPELGTIVAERTAVRRCSPRTPPASCPRRSSGAACSCTSTTPTPSGSGRSCCAGARPRRAAGRGSWSRIVGRLRDIDLKKAPSIAETIDWARTLVALGSDTSTTS